MTQHYKNRLSKKELPLNAQVQVGTVVLDDDDYEISWSDPTTSELTWDKTSCSVVVTIDGIATNFAGWEDIEKVYLPTSDDIFNECKALRVNTISKEPKKKGETIHKSLSKAQKITVTKYTESCTKFITTFLQKCNDDGLSTDEAIGMLRTESIQKELYNMIVEASPVPRIQRKKKDPNAPKRPLSGYIFFCKDNRDKVKLENPGIKGTDITKELAKLWKAQSDREKWKLLALKDKERYASDMKEWDGKGPKKGPKKALSSYIFFCSEMRPKIAFNHPDKKPTDISRLLGKLWKGKYADDRSKWETLANADKKRYANEKESFVELVATIPKKKKTPVKTVDSDPDSDSDSESDPDESINNIDSHDSSRYRPCTNGQMYFIMEEKDELKHLHPSWSPKRISDRLIVKWNDLDQEERNAYNEMASA